MPIEVVEKFDSRHITTGRSPVAEFRYDIFGTDDEKEARAALVDETNESYDPWGEGLVFLPRERTSVEPVGPQHWEGVVVYSAGAPATESSVFAFDTGGGTQHITQSRQTVGRYPATAPNFQGAIGVTSDNVEGVDVTVPVYQFSETHYLPDAVVTPAYRITLFQLTGRVNNASFKGFAVGEVLFLGASGQRRGNGDWELTYRFAASPNATGLTIGDITGVNKKGWEYLWVRYADSEDVVAKALVKKPIAVYVERVYDDGNMSLLGV